MKNLFIIPVILLILVFFNATFAQKVEKKDIEAKISLEIKDKSLNISGQAINYTSQEYQLRYELSVITGNENNSSSSQNNQSGSFLLPASGTKTLSRTSISKNPGSKAIIKLNLLNNDKVVARDSVIFQF